MIAASELLQLANTLSKAQAAAAAVASPQERPAIVWEMPASMAAAYLGNSPVSTDEAAMIATKACANAAATLETPIGAQDVELQDWNGVPIGTCIAVLGSDLKSFGIPEAGTGYTFVSRAAKAWRDKATGTTSGGAFEGDATKALGTALRQAVEWYKVKASKGW